MRGIVDIHARMSGLLRRFGLSRVYRSSVGIKCQNQLLDSDLFTYFERGTVEHIHSDRLHIGFDALVDNLTLLGTPIADSPHVDLVERLEKGQDSGDCEYVQRVRRGTLDFRSRHAGNAAFLLSLSEACQKSRTAISINESRPIQVFNVEGKHYIANGKHRAALCVVMGIEPLCVDVSLALFDSFYWWVYQAMNRQASGFRRHLEWFDAAKRTVRR